MSRLNKAVLPDKFSVERGVIFLTAGSNIEAII